jgi:polyphenol oxidase
MNNHYIYPNWHTPSQVRAVTTLRTDGLSLKPYESFNLAHHVGDNPAHVLANRIKLRQELNLTSEPIWLKQTHSNKIICANNAVPYIEADASYATKSNVVCVVLTADCLPILLCDKNGTTIAAIHAGWKSLAASIIENTIANLKINPKNLLVWLGPAISSGAFIVGNEVYEKFIQHDPRAQKAFISCKSNSQKRHANIYILARQRLTNCGIISANIYGGEYCTYSDHRFFSYRRDGEKTGRMASLIWMTVR